MQWCSPQSQALCSRTNFYGLGLGTDGLGLEDPGLGFGLEICTDIFCIIHDNKSVTIYIVHVINNKLISEQKQNLVHYLSCQAVRRTAYFNLCCVCLKWPRDLWLGLGLEGPGLKLNGWDLGLKILASTLSVIICSLRSHHWRRQKFLHAGALLGHYNL